MGLFLVKNVNSTSCPILLFPVLCKRWVFPLISSCVDCSALSSSSSAFLEFPPSCCCRCRYILGISAFLLLSSSAFLGFPPCASGEYLPRALPMSCFGEKCLQEKENFHFPEIVARVCSFSSSSSSSFF